MNRPQPSNGEAPSEERRKAQKHGDEHMENETRNHRLSILSSIGEANEKVTHHDFASKDELILFLVSKFNSLHPNPEFIIDGPHMRDQPWSTWFTREVVA